MSYKKYIFTIIVTALAFILFNLWNMPVDNNVIYLGLCVLGHAFIAYQEK